MEKEMHLKNLFFSVNTVIFFRLLPKDSSSEWAASYEEAASPKPLYTFIRLEQVK